jgi:16S rRNA (uracil1498-N3)-methyltransferase
MQTPSHSAASGPVSNIPRFYVADRLHQGATQTLDAATSRHVQALRLRRGDRVALFNGDGHEYAAELIDLSRRGAVVLVRAATHADRESPLPVVLAQGVCAADRMDLVIQKATELGVARIIPVVTSRSIVRLSNERQERRETHWQNVAIAACEQCRRNRIPQVDATIKFDAFIASLPDADARIVLAGDGEARLGMLPKPASVLLFVGPEGGLAAEERALLASRAFTEVRFGPRVLRTETAPIAAIATMQAFWGDC